MTKKNTSPFKPETITDIVQYCGSEESLLAAFKSLRKAAIESALEGELGHHLGYCKNERNSNTNSRNGYGEKTIITDHGGLTIQTPRDRDASFEPQLIQKNQRKLKGFDAHYPSLKERD